MQKIGRKNENDSCKDSSLENEFVSTYHATTTDLKGCNDSAETKKPDSGAGSEVDSHGRANEDFCGVAPAAPRRLDSLDSHYRLLHQQNKVSDSN